MIVHLVRSHLASPDVKVTESKLLLDAHLGIEREVDVVIEGQLDGEPIVTSIEVIEHRRPASVTWVEQQIAKHRYLPTNRLVLVSKSGFSKNALAMVAAEGGKVAAVRPEVVESGGQPVIQSLFVAQVHLVPTACHLRVTRPARDSVLVRALADNTVFDSHRNELGSAVELVREALGLDWVGRSFLIEIRGHPDKDELTNFMSGFSVGTLDYHLHDQDTDELHRITEIHLEGEFEYAQEEIHLTVTQLAGHTYAAGQSDFLGKQMVWVGTTDDNAGTMTFSWRSKDDTARQETSSPPRKFRGLLDIVPPKQFATDADTSEDGPLGG